MCIELFSVVIYYLISTESIDFKKKYYIENFYNTDLSLRYFIISLFGSINILFGIAFIFFFYGSFDNKIISLYFIPNIEGLEYICGNYSNFGFIIFIIGFCIKFGIAPYHFWINGVYDRFKTFFFQYIIIFPKSILLCFIINFFSNFYSDCQIDNKLFSVFFLFTFLGMLNIFFGTFSAFVQTDLKRLLMYSSLTNVGYVFLCIGSNVENSFFIAYSYIIHYTLALFVLFRVINEIEVKINRLFFQWNFSEFSIISFKHKVFITFSFFNLAGLPPFPLFFGKFFIFSHFWINEFFFVFFFMSFFSIIGYAYYFNFIRFIWFNEKFSYFSIFSKVSFYEKKLFNSSNFFFSKIADTKKFFFWSLREGKFSNFYWNFNFEDYFIFNKKQNNDFFDLWSNYNFFFFNKFNSFIEKFEKTITRFFFYFFFIGFFSVSYFITFFKRIFVSYSINKYFFGKKIIFFFFIPSWNENINFYFIEKKNNNQNYYSKNNIFDQLNFFNEKAIKMSNIFFENNIFFWFKKNFINSVNELVYFFFKKFDSFFIINHYGFNHYNSLIHNFYRYQIYENSVIFLKLFTLIVIFFIFFFIKFVSIYNYGFFSFFIFSNFINKYFICSVYFIGLVFLNFFKIFSFFKFFVNNKSFNNFISWIEYNIIIFSFFIWFFFIYVFFTFFTDLNLIRYLLGLITFFFIYFSYPKTIINWFNYNSIEKKTLVQNSSIDFKLKIYKNYQSRKGFFWKKYLNLMIFDFNLSVNFFIILSIFLISMSYSAIVHYNYSFLHLLLIYELIFLSICLFFSVTSYINDQIDGDIMILFIIGVIAAETAIGISFYINTLIGNNFYDSATIDIQKKTIQKEKNIIFYQNIKSVLYKKNFLWSVIVVRI